MRTCRSFFLAPVWGAMLVVFGMAGVQLGCGSEPSPSVPVVAASEPADPQAAYTSYSVEERGGYVGDEACADCHEELYLSYHETGMGRSVTRFEAADAPERLTGVRPVYNERFDLYYEPFVRGDTLLQREYRLDERGQVVYERVHAADYVIGSGNATRSYLMEENGYVTEMPLTWYVERAMWDMSPGYTQSNVRFSRPINLECMTCHNGLPAHSPFTQAHYAEVPLGITCERCHGPGGEHVEARLAGLEPPPDAPDPTILNPAFLDRDRQLSVCQQCHLTGTTVFDEGEDPTTFLPGQLLATHRSVYVPEEHLDDPEQFGIASHALRLALSACFEESAMTCTTCHDPHVPVAQRGPEAFNAACLSCHGADAEADPDLCSREDDLAPAEAMSGNCISCHMQKSGTSDIPHVTFTDHWIRRTTPADRPATSTARDVETMHTRAEPFELVEIEGGTVLGAGDEALEEAIAYFTFFDTMHPVPAYLPRIVASAREGLAGRRHAEGELVLGRALAAMDSLQAATEVLERAAAQFPNHALIQYWRGAIHLRANRPTAAVAALQRAAEAQPLFVEAQLKLASALDKSGRRGEALVAYERALVADSLHHPSGWNDYGFALLQQRDLEEAERAFRRALHLDPDLAIAHVNLGSALLIQQRYEEATRAFERATTIDPTNVAAYGNLGLAYAQLGDLAKARASLERVLALNPGDARARSALAQLAQMEGQR